MQCASFISPGILLSHRLSDQTVYIPKATDGQGGPPFTVSIVLKGGLLGCSGRRVNELGFCQHFLQFATLVHLKHDVTPANELSFEVHLRDRRPRAAGNDIRLMRIKRLRKARKKNAAGLGQ